MRVKERESWIANNVGKGGKKSSFSEFNKEFKGKERNPSAREFASMDVEEYHHYSATQDKTKPEKVKKDETSNSGKNNNSSSKNVSSKVANQTASIAKSVVSNVVAVVVGSVVIVNTYQAIAEPNYTLNWKWSADYISASLEFLDEDGTVVKEIPAIVTVTTEDATCTNEGKKTFSATVNDEDGHSYFDEHSQTLAPHKHNKKNQKIIYFPDGSTVIEYECDECHEIFTITIQGNEN